MLWLKMYLSFSFDSKFHPSFLIFQSLKISKFSGLMHPQYFLLFRYIADIKDGKNINRHCLLWIFIEWMILRVDSCKMKSEIQFFIRVPHTEKKIQNLM